MTPALRYTLLALFLLASIALLALLGVWWVREGVRAGVDFGKIFIYFAISP
jgi:hypothetical protein